MGISSVIDRMEASGFRLGVEAGRLWVEPVDRLTPEQCEWLRTHKAEIVAELQRRRPGNHMAVLLTLPDEFKFWLAPDELTFDAGGIPVLRRSVMDKLECSGADVKAELKRLITSMRELGGDLRMADEIAKEARL